MKQKNFLWLLMLLAFSPWTQAQLQPFKDNVESHGDFQQNNLIGWTSLDLDGYNTSGPFQSFPGKGGPLGFIVYNPSKTTPVNTLPGYEPRSGGKYFASISSYSGPVNDWLISDELAAHSGGKFSFYARTAATFAGFDKLKIAYSTTGFAPTDFIFLNNGTPTTTTANWVKYEYTIPADAKHLAINCVSEAFMVLIDDIEFTANTAATAPSTISSLTTQTQVNNGFRAVFNWNNPTTDIAGNPLTAMTGVKVYRGTHPMNLALIADLPSGPGAAVSYTDVLPGEGTYMHSFVPYNASGAGKPFDTPLTFFGYETVAGAPTNITFTQNAELQTVISWNAVDYGAGGGVLQNPVVGYRIVRTLGSVTETLADMHPSTTFTETAIPALNLYTYTITAQTAPTELGVPATVSAHSGLNANQESVTTGVVASNQPFELTRTSIISQSIYTAAEIGSTGLITSLSYFANLANATPTRYKIYMSLTERNTFGTTSSNAVWEYYANQKLLFDGDIVFPTGRAAVNILLDQPFYYDAAQNKNVIITIIRPLSTTSTTNATQFYNTPVDGMRTYYANGYSADLSVITSQPAAWSTEQIPTIPSIVVEKKKSIGSVTGTVTTNSSGVPLDGVTIKIVPNDAAAYQTETVLTNAAGTYTIPALLPGNYKAVFTKDTFNTLEIEFSIAANQQLTLDATLDDSVPILITGTTVDPAGNALAGIKVSITGFSTNSTISDASGNYTLNAFAEKSYTLTAENPLYNTVTQTIVSASQNQTLDPIVMVLALHKPGDIEAVNNNGVGEISWRVPVGRYNETMLGWGSFITAGDSYGLGGDAFTAAVRFETSDLQTKVTPGAELTHVKVYFANNANAVIKIFTGTNASTVIHSQPVSVTDEGWYVFELTKSLPVDFTKELWIGVEFLANQYGAYPIGLDDGPNAPGRKGSMRYYNGVWTAQSLTNTNWNIYGIANNTQDAAPTGYKVYRSPAAEETWTELTPSPITTINFSDATLAAAAPNSYKYGVTAEYGNNLVSEKGISNSIDHKMYFDFTLKLTPDSGSSQGAYVALWNEENFAERVMPAGNSVTFTNLKHGTYNMRVELDNYEIINSSQVVVDDHSTLTLPLNLLKVKPSNLKATLENSTSARLDWTLHGTYTDQFEKYADFERVNIGPYLLKDLDGLNTYTYTSWTWPNAGTPMSYMVFNPFSTSPPVTGIDALSGRRFLTAFAGPDGPNNDWLIIPAGPGQFGFNASSLSTQMLENMQVLYSVTGTEVADFTAFDTPITVPKNWTRYLFEAPEGTRYVAVNYISNDSYILKIDDLTYERGYNHALSYNVYLDGNLIQQNITNPTFVLENLSLGNHVAHVEAVYATGVSEKTEVNIAMLNVQDAESAEVQVYPNPSNGQFWVNIKHKATLSLFDMTGKLLYTAEKEVGNIQMEHRFPAGSYLLRIQTEKGVTTKKLIFK